MGRGAWLSFVGGVNCLVNSVIVCTEKEEKKVKRREDMVTAPFIYENVHLHISIQNHEHTHSHLWLTLWCQYMFLYTYMQMYMYLNAWMVM